VRLSCDLVHLAVEFHRLAVQEGHENGEVLAGVPGRALETQSEHRFDTLPMAGRG
jgi:hypothetical protein